MEKRTIDSNKLHELRISRFALKLLFVADRLHNPYAEVLNRKLLMIIGQWYLHNLQPMHAEVLNRTTHRTIHAHIATRPAAEPFTCHKVIPIGAALNYHKSGSHVLLFVTGIKMGPSDQYSFHELIKGSRRNINPSAHFLSY